MSHTTAKLGWWRLVALALPGAPVAQHAVHPHMSSIELKLFILEYACREAKLTYSAHAVTKDCGPPPLYHPGILRGLSERQYAEVAKSQSPRNVY